MIETTTPAVLPPETAAPPKHRAGPSPIAVPGSCAPAPADASSGNAGFALLLAAALEEDARSPETPIADPAASAGAAAPGSEAPALAANAAPRIVDPLAVRAPDALAAFAPPAPDAPDLLQPIAGPAASQVRTAPPAWQVAAKDEARAPATQAPSAIASAAARSGAERLPVHPAEAPRADPPAPRAQVPAPGEPLAAALAPAAAPAADTAPARHAAVAPPPPAPYAADPLAAPRPGAPGFDDAFAARVSIAVRSGAQSASIALDPPQLGPVDVQIELRGAEAHVAFAAAQASAREAIAEALPRLREMLAAHGLELAGSSVGEELPHRDAPAGNARAENRDPPPEAPGTDAAVLLPRAAPRLVDTFA